MVNRLDKLRDGKGEMLTQRDVAAINYFSETLPLNNLKPKDTPRFDELIVSLASSHENARTLQVMEWEKMRRQHFPLSM